MTPKAVLFDFDGTIFHYESIHHNAIRTVFEEWSGDDVDYDELVAYGGLPYADRFEHMLVMRGVDDPALVTVLEKKARAIMHENISPTNALVPGVIEFMQELYEEHIPLGVVSSATRDRLENDLSEVGIAPMLSTIVGFEDVTMKKPHPQPYLKALEHIATSPKEAVAFEDSPAGIEAAQLAGIAVIGLRTTFTDSDLEKATTTISDYTKIEVKLLGELLS